MPELTTTVRITDASPVDIPEIARIVEQRLVDAIHDEGIATITAYFVTPDAAHGRLRIGLRFQGMDESMIEETATDVLTLALEGLTETSSNRAAVARRIGTKLVGV